jgi:hypothetical protein
MKASQGGHTETLALLLANKADVHASDNVIIIFRSFEIDITCAIARMELRNVCYIWRTHRDTRAASGQQS